MQTAMAVREANQAKSRSGDPDFPDLNFMYGVRGNYDFIVGGGIVVLWRAADEHNKALELTDQDHLDYYIKKADQYRVINRIN